MLMRFCLLSSLVALSQNVVGVMVMIMKDMAAVLVLVLVLCRCLGLNLSLDNSRTLGVLRLLQRMRQHVQKSIAHHGTGSKCQEQVHHLLENTVVEKESCRPDK